MSKWGGACYVSDMRSTGPLVAMALLLAGCPRSDTDPAPIETLTPEPPGAPTDPIDGRWTCLGHEENPSWGPGSVQLTGYVRTYADPTATANPPAATLSAFDERNNAVGTGFADPSHAGRVSMTVPVDAEGFKGYLIVSQPGYLDYRFQASRPFTTSFYAGWAWLMTASERDAEAAAVGADVPAGARILLGSVHDCDGMGVQNAVITVDDATDGLLFVEGFAPVEGRAFTTTSGRFVMPEMGANRVEVAAWGRLEAGGPLQLLSRVEARPQDGGISAVALEPRPE